MRNRRLDMRMSELGITEEDRIKAGKEMGEHDCTDLHNPFVSLAISLKSHFELTVRIVPVLSMMHIIPLAR